MWILWRLLVAWRSQVLVEASDLNAVQFCRKELKNQEVEDDEMQAGLPGICQGSLYWIITEFPNFVKGNVGIRIISPPVITSSIVGMFTIPRKMGGLWHCCAHISIIHYNQL